MSVKKVACGQKTEIYSRVVGYYRPVQNWNKGKREEFALRKTFSLAKSVVEDHTTETRCFCPAESCGEERAIAVSA